MTRQQMLINKLAEGSSRALARCRWLLPATQYSSSPSSSSPSSSTSSTSSSSLSRCRHWSLSGSQAGRSSCLPSSSFFSQLRSIATSQSRSRSSSLAGYGRCAATVEVIPPSHPRSSFLPPQISSPSRFTAPTLSRWMSSNPTVIATGVDGDLAGVLRSEYDYELQNYKPSPVARKGPPAPFIVQDTPGTNGIILRRSFDKEDIEVAIYVQPEDFVGGGEEEGMEEEEVAPPPSPISFTVTVTKSMNGPKLEFQCSTDGEEVGVDFLALHEATDDERIKATAYDGPDYNTLDHDVKTAFGDYLKARGIDGKLAAYVVEIVRDKEQREYTRWLDQMQRFLLHGR